jgi:hypothetical protein
LAESLGSDSTKPPQPWIIASGEDGDGDGDGDGDEEASRGEAAAAAARQSRKRERRDRAMALLVFCVARSLAEKEKREEKLFCSAENPSLGLW